MAECRPLKASSPSLPFQLKTQPVNLLHVKSLSLGVRRAARVYAAGDARAVEGQLASRAVETRAREPGRHAAARQRAEGRAHPPAHGAKAKVVRLREQPRR